MARRSRQNETTESLITDIGVLLGDFEAALCCEDLREKVLELVPLQNAFRRLGPSLFPKDISVAKDRIVTYFRRYPHVVLTGDEISVVSGIQDWPRRIRELRKQEGWSIFSGKTVREMLEEEPELEQSLSGRDFSRSLLKVDNYVLTSTEQDRDAAHRWHSLNCIRKRAASIKVKVLEHLRDNVGRPVSGEELRYVSNDRTEWARRVRELRTEEGWHIATRQTGRPDLAVGYYVLEDERQAPVHDRAISDGVRITVLDRDGFRCTCCAWDPKMRVPGDPRHILELHHVRTHASGGENTAENLMTLCNVCHDRVHATTKA